MAAEYVAMFTNKMAEPSLHQQHQAEAAPITSIPSGTLLPLRYNSNSATDFQGSVKELARMVASGTIAILDEIELNGPESVRLREKVEALSGVIEVLRNKL